MRPRRAVYNIAFWLTVVALIPALPIRWLRKVVGGPTASLWTGTPILTVATNCRSERLLGVNAKSLALHTFYITDEFDYNLSRFTSKRLVGAFVPLFAFYWACIRMDRLHFFCDRGIFAPRSLATFDFRELYVYRLLGIEVFLWTYGADVRNQATARAMGDPNPCTDCDSPGKYCICDPVKAASNLDKLSANSKAIFAGMGEMFGYTPGSIDDLFFWPLDLDAQNGEKYKPHFPDSCLEKPLRIVHASNHRMFKGTRFLIDAVEELIAEGEQIELVLVEKKSNKEALEIYRSADVIFDQCIMGNYGYFALEGLALGKPVMCFVRHPETYLLAPEECPIIRINVSTLKEDLRETIRNRTELYALGKRGRGYIERYFTLEAFSERLRSAYIKLGVKP